MRPVITISKKEIREHILFTIDGDTYHAEEGMTWSEWVDSEYNTDGFYFGGRHAGVVFPGSGVTYYVCDAIESPVGPNEIINSNFSYLKQQVSAGGSN